jgi:hypothetical protein
MNETEILDLLEKRFTRCTAGNGMRRYSFARHARSGAGFDATHTFDAVAIDLWPSSGLLVHIIEVKISRSDWLRELKDPNKTQGAIECGDTFSVCAPKGVVKPEDLRPGWGWYEISGERLVCKRIALRNQATGDEHFFRRGKSDVTFNRSFAVALMRAVEKTAMQKVAIKRALQVLIEAAETQDLKYGIQRALNAIENIA